MPLIGSSSPVVSSSPVAPHSPAGSSSSAGSTTPSDLRLTRRLQKRNERGETPLHVAAIRGNFRGACKLIREGADVNAADFAGWTPLHEACNHGWFSIAKALIKAGASVTVRGCDDETPLHDACVNGHVKLVKLLLKAGADPHQKNSRGKSPIDVSLNPEIISLLAGNCTESEHSDRETEVDQADKENSPVVESSCEMSRRSSQLAHSKGAFDRLTLRLQQVRGMDRKTPVKTSDSPASENRAHFSVAMELGKDKKSEDDHDMYEFKSGTDVSPPASLRSQGIPEAADTDSMFDPAVMSAVDGNSPKKSPASSGDDKHRTDNSAAKQEEKKEDNNSKRGACEMDEEEEDSKKKRRKEDGKDVKDINTTKNGNGRNGRGSSNGEKSKNGNHKNGGSNKPGGGNGNGDRKSPTSVTATVASPKGSVGKAGSHGGSESESDSEDKKGQEGMPKVPPLKIVIPTSSGEQEPGNRNGKSNVPRQLPYVVNTSQDESPLPAEGQTNSCSDRRDSPSSADSDKSSSHRVTRSQKALHSLSGEASPESCSKVEEKVEEPSPTPTPPQPVELHPRKRKLRPREPETETTSQPPVPSLNTGDQQQVTNCYDIYLNIRRQIDRRRRNLFPVQPKPPQGFKDYLMNRCSYVLAGNAQSRLSVPMIPPPQSLTGPPMRDLFVEQEKERYKLRLQHLIEKEKLVLSVEQEILRVHGRAARALANQSLPFSVCTILKDEEVYNVITPEQEEKDRNARSRYNGRLFLSWLQDVDDKWEKIKEAMLLRHHNEAESLHAVQKMDWEWKLREHSHADPKTVLVIDDLHVPMVHVSDDFDLLPA